MEIVKHGEEEEFAIKPQASVPHLDTSSWPLLLKNYDKRKFSLSSWTWSDRSSRSSQTND